MTKVMQPVLDSLEKNIVELLGDMEASVDNVNDDDKVNAIVVARQVASKGRSINSSSKEVGLGGEVRTACEDLVDKCSRFEKHTFNSWVEDAEDAGATVGLNEQLMGIKEGMLEVNYDEEVRRRMYLMSTSIDSASNVTPPPPPLCPSPPARHPPPPGPRSRRDGLQGPQGHQDQGGGGREVLPLRHNAQEGVKLLQLPFPPNHPLAALSPPFLPSRLRGNRHLAEREGQGQVE